MSFYKEGSSNCMLEFHSNVEGIATTYANLYRRVLLQSVPRMAVAGIKCVVDGKVISNLFQVVDGLKGTLLDLNQILHTTVFNVDTEDEDVILSINLDGDFLLSDLTNPENYYVSEGAIRGINLVSDDSLLASVVGNHKIILYIYFRKGIGFIQKDVNTIRLSEVIGDNSVSDWIVSDSQHRGVSKVQYKSDVQLGRQTVTLHINSYEPNIEDIVNNCTLTILEQVGNFKIS